MTGNEPQRSLGGVPIDKLQMSETEPRVAGLPRSWFANTVDRPRAEGAHPEGGLRRYIKGWLAARRSKPQ
jgi:hypothetical protein